MIKKVIFSILLFLCLIVNVYAEDNNQENYNNCPTKDRAELNKLASSVEAAYEIKYDDSNNPYIKISVYNVTDKIDVNITNSLFPKDIEVVLPSMTNNGTYSFNSYDIDNVVTYTFNIRGNVEGCGISLRKITLIKPKYNDVSELTICKNEKLVDYEYCQPWIEKQFNLDREDILEKINNYVRKENIIITKKNKNENSSKNKIEKYNQIRQYIIIGLSIGIVLDITNITYMIYRIKRYSI